MAKKHFWREGDRDVINGILLSVCAHVAPWRSRCCCCCCGCSYLLFMLLLVKTALHCGDDEAHGDAGWWVASLYWINVGMLSVMECVACCLLSAVVGRSWDMCCLCLAGIVTEQSTCYRLSFVSFRHIYWSLLSNILHFLLLSILAEPCNPRSAILTILYYKYFTSFLTMLF